MYEQSSGWNEYYRELDPSARRALLDRMQMSEPDDGANEYRIRLFQTRYVDEKKTENWVDRFLFQCVNFIQLYKSMGPFRKSARKELKKALGEMLFEDAGLYGEAGEKALYWEIRNASARYFKTCESSGYGRSLFGLLSSGEVNRMERMCRDTWEMTEGLEDKYEMAGDMKIWSRAVKDSFFASGAGAEAAYYRYLQKSKKENTGKR